MLPFKLLTLHTPQLMGKRYNTRYIYIYIYILHVRKFVGVKNLVNGLVSIAQ